MSEILKPGTLELFLMFIVPGFVTLKVYDLLVPSERRDFTKSLIEVVSYSMINLALMFPFVHAVKQVHFATGHPWAYRGAMFSMLLIMPAALAVGACGAC